MKQTIIRSIVASALALAPAAAFAQQTPAPRPTSTMHAHPPVVHVDHTPTMHDRTITPHR